MKKILSILLTLILLFPFVMVKTEAGTVNFSKFNSEINAIELYELAESTAKTASNSIYPYTAVSGDLVVFANGTTSGTYKCLVYGTDWENATTADKTMAELISAHKQGTHVAVSGKVCHKHGLDTADTSDDITFDKILTNGGSLSGNYYLTSDITLTQQLLVSSGYSAKICLCGHTINLNGNYINNRGSLEIISCTDTEHKFKVNSDGSYTLDESNGSVTLKGGLITGTVCAEDNYGIWNGYNCSMTLTNINIAGIEVNVRTAGNKGSLDVIGSSGYLTVDNCKFYGNHVFNNDDVCMGIIYTGLPATIKNSEFKYNVSTNEGFILGTRDETNMILDNVVVSNNKIGMGAFFIYTGGITLKNKVVIYDNVNAENKQRNIAVQDQSAKPRIVLDTTDKLAAGSKIGISPLYSLWTGANVRCGIVTGYETTYDNYFVPDTDDFFLKATTEGETTYLSFQHRVKAQPSYSNYYTFQLHEDRLSKCESVTYKWKQPVLTEIVEKQSGTQDYVSKSFSYCGYYSCTSKYENGYWVIDKVDPTDDDFVGLTMELKKGDVIVVKSNFETSITMAPAPNYDYWDSDRGYGTAVAFTIKEDGIYGFIVEDSNAKMSVYKVTSYTYLPKETSASLTNVVPGLFVCEATVKDYGRTLTFSSEMCEVVGVTVKFVLQDTTLTVDDVVVAYGQLLTKPQDPDGIKVLGWYYDEYFGYEWNFDSHTVDYEWTLYGKYELALAIKGGDLVVNKAADNCVITVGEGFDITLANFQSFTFNGTTYNKSELQLIDPLDESKGYTNGTFTFENGCIKITMPKSFMNNLAFGNYDVAVELTGGAYDGVTLTGTVKVANKVVGTSVENSALKLIALASITLSAIYVATKKKH